jgi:DNA-binding NtrC family response regulator
MVETTPGSQTLHDSSPAPQSGATGVQVPRPGTAEDIEGSLDRLRTHVAALRAYSAGTLGAASDYPQGSTGRRIREAQAAGVARMAEEVGAAVARLERVLGQDSVFVESLADALTAEVMGEIDRAPARPAKNASVRPYRDERRDFDRGYWRRVLGLARGNISEAARLADKTRKEVYEALRRLGLENERRALSARERGPRAVAAVKTEARA